MIPGVIPSIPPPQRLAITFLDGLTLASTSSTYSLGSVTATTPGLLVVTINSLRGTASVVSNVSIGGTTGTVHVASLSSTAPCALASRVVTSGSQAIQALFSTTSSSGNVLAGAWLITGYRSTTPCGFDTNTQTISTISGETTFDMLSPSVGVFGLVKSSSDEGSWSSATSRFSSTVNMVTRRSVLADKVTPITLSSHVEVFTPSTINSAGISMVGGAWR